jgi:hypothetical protein
LFWTFEFRISSFGLCLAFVYVLSRCWLNPGELPMLEQLLGFVAGLLCILTFIAVLGHGLWVAFAACFRWLTAQTVDPEPGRQKSSRSWCDELEATQRQLNWLRNQALIDDEQCAALLDRMNQFEQKMLAEHAMKRHVSPVDDLTERAPPDRFTLRPEHRLGAEPRDSWKEDDASEAILVEAELVSPVSEGPRTQAAGSAGVAPPVRTLREDVPTRPLHPLDRDYADTPRPPSLARRTLADLFQSFMAEKNIRWGELVSGLLIVGSAVGLVISLRATLTDTIPYFPALIFLLITLAIYGAGMYTLRRWNLQGTSRGVLIIALLLSPLNFVAAIVLSGPDQRSVTDPWYWGAVGLGLLVCGGITASGGRALIGAGWWRLTTVVLATSMGQLIVDRQTEVPLTAWGTALLLALPLAGYLLAVVSQIVRAVAWPRLSARRAQQVFIVLGIATFSFLPPVALFLSHAEAWREAVASLSPVLSLMAAAILATGLLVHRRTEARSLAAIRTSGTALAVAGAMLMVSALVLAWPRPELLILVGLVNGVMLTVLALMGRLPVLHVPAVGCAALAGLIGFHVWQANLTWGGQPPVQQVVGWLLAGRSGLLLLLLSILAAVGAAAWSRVGRRAESLAYWASAGGLGGLSLLVAFWAGFADGRDVPLATPVFAFYALAALAAACELGRRGSDRSTVDGLAWAATVLWLAALVHALWQNQVCIDWLSTWLIEPDRPWTLALVTHSLTIALTALGLAVPRFRAAGQRQDPIGQAVIPALTGSGLISSLAAVWLILAATGFAFAPGAIYLACASVAWLVAAAVHRHPPTWAVFQTIASLAVIYAVAGWDPSWWPIRDTAGLVQVLRAETFVLGLWCMAWSLVRRLVRSQPGIDAVLREPCPAWPPVDQCLLYVLVPVAVGLGVAAAWRGLAWEVAGHATDTILAADGWTWIAVAAVAAALTVSLVDRSRPEALIGLLVCGAAGMLLLAAWGPIEVTGSAWRWWSAGYALVTAAAVWFRGPIHASLARVRWLAPWEFPQETAAAVRETALFLSAGPILAVTTAVAIRTSAGWSVGELPADSFFYRVGMTVSYAVPLVVLVAVLLGHALRERRPVFAVAGSVILQYVVSLAFLLKMSPGEPGFVAGLLQWNLAALGGYSLAWLALRRRISPDGQGQADLPLGIQTAATTALLGVLGVWAALSVAFSPGQLAPGARPLGEWLTFVGWLAACAAAVWYQAVSKPGQTPSRPAAALMLRMAVACGWLLVALVAVAVDPLDVSREWWAYHVLTVGGLLLTALLTVGWWRHPGLIGDAAVSGGLVLLLGLRGGWSDPHVWAPWWSVAACSAVAVQWAAFSLRARRQGWAYASALAAVSATTIYWLGPFQGRWQRDGAQAVLELIVADLVVLLVAAALWLGAEIWWQRREGRTGLDERFRGARMYVVASLLALVWLSLMFFGAAVVNTSEAARQAAPALDLVAGGGWLAAVLLLVVLAGALWEDRARHAIGGLYVGGLMFAVLIVDRLRLKPDSLLVTALVVVAAYVMVTGWAWRRGASLARFGAGLGVRDPLLGLQRTDRWLPGVNLLLALGTSLIALIVVSVFRDRALRYGAAAAPAVLAVGIGALAQSGRRAAMQVLALLLTGLATVYLGWADLEPRWGERDLLLRMFRLLMALSVLTFVYGALLPRWLGRQHPWHRSTWHTAATFGVAGLASLLGVLALEWVAFWTGGVRIDDAQVAAVAVVLVALIAGLIALALQAGGVLSTWSEQQRMAFVFGAELVAALLFVHIYLCRPEWFAGFLLPYWPYIIMAIAFVGVTIGHGCQRSGLRVLSEPLVGTGAFLPLLPALGYWVVVAEGTEYSDYSLLLFTVGLMYVVLSMLRRSAASAAAAVVAGNGALWALLHDQGFSLWQQPQFWLIPPAVSVLIAGQVNRHRLTGEQLTALRYASMLVIYVSSTSEMFLRGIGASLWPPMILASLSVGGVMLGIALRVRAFLYLGTSFVLLSVVSMVWHAARAIEHSWPWWAFGIGLGLAILTMFAVFEKNRPEIQRWAESMRRWEQ